MAWFLRAMEICRLVSPELRSAVHARIDELIEVAKSTPSPVDNAFAGALRIAAMVAGLY